MDLVPKQDVLLLAGVLFALGVTGILIRRNLVFMLMSVEIMLNAAGLAFVAAGAYQGHPDGQVMLLFVLVSAAAEVSVGLALLFQIHRRFHHVDADAAVRLRD